MLNLRLYVDFLILLNADFLPSVIHIVDFSNQTNFKFTDLIQFYTRQSIDVKKVLKSTGTYFI